MFMFFEYDYVVIFVLVLLILVWIGMFVLVVVLKNGVIVLCWICRVFMCCMLFIRIVFCDGLLLIVLILVNCGLFFIFELF